jgi:hypothetical protein
MARRQRPYSCWTTTTGVARSTAAAITPTSGVMRPTPTIVVTPATAIVVCTGTRPVVKAAVAAQAPSDQAKGYRAPARLSFHSVAAPTRSATRSARK